MKFLLLNGKNAVLKFFVVEILPRVVSANNLRFDAKKFFRHRPYERGLAVSLSRRVWLYDSSPAPRNVQRGIDVCIKRVSARSTDKVLLVSKTPAARALYSMNWRS